jgi:hypothetical protein
MSQVFTYDVATLTLQRRTTYKHVAQLSPTKLKSPVKIFVKI